MTRGKRRSLLLLVLLAVVINLPFLHSSWTGWRIEGSGVDVTATVTDTDAGGAGADEFWIAFRFDEDVDPEQQIWNAQVDEATYDEAERTRQVEVRVLEGDPSAYRVEGAVGSNVVFIATLIADVVLALLFVLVWRSGGRRGQLRAVALEDVERAAPGVLLERLRGEEYLIRGDVLELEPGQVLLDVGNRTVLVLLDGYENPVGYQQTAQVRARML